jgi:Fur family transcriptional regulator, zinc uptake regulator
MRIPPCAMALWYNPTMDALSDRLARAEAACARRGAKLTETRREVLRLILESPEPIGAYALLDRLRAHSGTGKPPTVYRALDFLLAQNLIHRVERLNAFVGCHDEAEHHHAAQFLICRQCGHVFGVRGSSVRKQFVFEKKNQKTFDYWFGVASRTEPK